jgi:hypothetical protein
MASDYTKEIGQGKGVSAKFATVASSRHKYPKAGLAV